MDAKLSMLVNKMLSEGVVKAEGGIDPLFDVLLQRHAEYRRKPQAVSDLKHTAHERPSRS